MADNSHNLQVGDPGEPVIIVQSLRSIRMDGLKMAVREGGFYFFLAFFYLASQQIKTGAIHSGDSCLLYSVHFFKCLSLGNTLINIAKTMFNRCQGTLTCG